MGNYVIGIVSSCLTLAYVFFQIMDSLYKEKTYENKKIFIWAFLIYLVIAILVNFIGIPILNTIYSMLALCILSFFLYDTSGKNVIINSCIIILYLALIDFIITTFFSSLFLSGTYSILQDSKLYLISGLANSVAELCTSNLLIQLINRCRIKKIEKVLNVYMVFLMNFEIGILYYLILPESVKLSCFLQELLRIDVIHCFASNSSTQFLFVA